jgi:MFS family permease
VNFSLLAASIGAFHVVFLLIQSTALFIAPLSELYGRNSVYHVSNVLFLVFTIACAVSSSFGMLIGFRFLAGIAGSTAITIGSATIADMFVAQERGAAMAIWAIGGLLGPVVGPIAGSYLGASKGWRCKSSPVAHQVTQPPSRVRDSIVNYQLSQSLSLN